MKRTKDIIIGSRLEGADFSGKMAIAVGTGVVKANDPSTIV